MHELFTAEDGGHHRASPLIFIGVVLGISALFWAMLAGAFTASLLSG